MIGCAGHKCQVESLAVSTHLPVDDGGVLRCAECVQETEGGQKGQSLLDFLHVQYEYRP